MAIFTLGFKGAASKRGIWVRTRLLLISWSLENFKPYPTDTPRQRIPNVDRSITPGMDT